MNVTQAEKKKVIARLKQFKQDYNFTSKEIAKELNTTEAAVSHWFNGDTLPHANKVEDIYTLFSKHCIPGIIRLPKNKHWLASIFIRVDDIKNPYASWIDDNWTGELPENFAKWIKDWEKEFPNPVIYRQYSPDAVGRAKCHLDLLKLNTTIEHKKYFIGYDSLAQAIQINCPYCFYEYDSELAQALVSGEDDGTT